MDDLIIDQLLDMIRAQQRLAKAMLESMKITLEEPNINTEKYLAKAIIKAEAAILSSDEIIAELHNIWERPQCL